MINKTAKEQSWLETRVNKIRRKILAGWYNVHHLYNYPESEFLLLEHARCISNLVFDLPSIKTGYHSIEVIKRMDKDPSYKGCYEHFFPRQISGWEIISDILEKKDKYTIHEFTHSLCTFSHVDVITPEENRLVMKYQTLNNFVSPQITYMQSGIELIKIQEMSNIDAWEVVINDIEYITNNDPMLHKLWSGNY